MANVTLDTDDESQTAVVIGQNAIFATHIKAGTITAEEILAGTITASEISSGQIFASQIQLPAAASGTSGNAGQFGTRKFTIDENGNMWWGNHTSIGDANTAGKSTITDTGVATFVGSVRTGNTGERIVLSDTGQTESGTGQGGGSSYLLGYTGDDDEETAGHFIFTEESNVGTVYLVAPRLHTGWNWSGLRIKDGNTTSTEASLYTSTGDWAGIVKGTDANGVTHSDGTFVISADGGLLIKEDGIYLLDSTPSPTTNRLYRSGSNLYWGTTQLDGGGGGGASSWYLAGGSTQEIEDGETVTFAPTTQSGTNLASISQSSNTITVSAVKTITTTSDSGKKGLVVTTASDASTGVSLSLGLIDASTITNSDYVPFTRGAGSVWNNYKITVSSLANADAFTDKFLLLSGGTMIGGNVIKGPSGSDLVLQGNTSQSAWLRGNNNSAYGVLADSGGATTLHYGTTANFSTANGYNRSFQKLQGVWGTDSAPMYGFTNDGDTGMYLYSYNKLAFTTGAATRMVIDGSGNVGIGDTTPDYKLDVAGSLGATTLSVTGASTLSSTTFGNTVTARDIVPSPNYSYSLGEDLKRWLKVWGIEAAFSGAVTVGSTLAVTGATTLSSTLGVGVVATGTAKLSVHGGLRFTAAASVADIYTGIGAVGTDIVAICTGNGERMRIDATGKVGIGTNTPGQLLDVAGTATASTFIVKSGTGAYAAGSLGYTDSAWGFIYRPPQAGTAAAHRFDTSNGTSLLQITETGNVGIGYSSPTWKLTINGNLYVNTNAQIVGTLTVNTTSTFSGTISAENIIPGGSAPFEQALGESSKRWVNVFGAQGDFNFGVKSANGSLTSPSYCFQSSTTFGMGYNHATEETSTLRATSIIGGGTSQFKALASGPWANLQAGSGGNVQHSYGFLYYISSREVIKERIVGVSQADALTRIAALRPVEFAYKEEAVDLGLNTMVGYNTRRGFIAEEVAAVDHWMAEWGWIDPDDPYKLVNDAKIALNISDHDLEDAVPVNYDDRAIVADLVAVVQQMNTRLAALESA